MNKENAQTATGYSLPVIVFIVFLILKLTGNLDWSWWLVASPLWIVASIIVVGMLVSMAMLLYRYRKNK